MSGCGENVEEMGMEERNEGRMTENYQMTTWRNDGRRIRWVKEWSGWIPDMSGW